MATPQRQYPPEPERRPELKNLAEGGAEKKVGPGWRFGFWWIWILVIAGIWYVGYGWGNSGGWLWGHGRHAGNTTQNDAEVSGPGLPILNASNKQGFVGQAFEIRNVPVERQASNQAVWIGSRFNSVPMLVVLPNGNDVTPPPAGANPPQVKGSTVTVGPNGAKTTPNGSTAGTAAPATNNSGNAGATGSANAGVNTSTGMREWLDVTGKVQKAPAAAQAKQQWGLSDADANQLESQGVYIEATQVQRAPQPSQP